MSLYTALVEWNRGTAVFTDNRYSRGHTWTFDGGIVVPASSSPTIVRLPMSVEAAVDPEEAFVASIASCHMLFVLGIAAEQGFTVDHYVDNAQGTLGMNADGRLAMLKVELRPVMTFSGREPSSHELSEIHHHAHDQCFIANSVNTEVVVHV